MVVLQVAAKLPKKKRDPENRGQINIPGYVIIQYKVQLT